MGDDKVQCAICNAMMTVINNRHLARHQLSTAQYKERFPNSPMISETVTKKLSARSIKANATRKNVPRSEAVKQSMRDAHARLPSRKGITTGPMSEEQKQHLSTLAKERYSDGFVHPMQGLSQSESTKQKISDTLSGRKIGPEAALKAVNTRRERGDDLAPMRGKTHSDETKRLISRKSRESFRKKRENNRAPMLERLEQANLRLLNKIDDDLFHLQCKTCDHVFTRTVACFQPSKFKIAICDQCFLPATISDGENAVANYLATFFTAKINRSDVTVIAPLELDILIKEVNLAIEYCGLYYHSVAMGRGRFYHQFKLKRCRENNLRLITIFEDEWLLKRPIVESMLRNACGTIQYKINARQCTVRELDTNESSAFLNANHIQGRGRSNVKYGLFYKDELISVMTFSKSEVSHRSTGWEINRFATKLNHTVRGGASRLFKQFIINHHPIEVTSYADLRWGDGKVYGSLGFVWVGDSVPNYWYTKGLKRYHRYALRKTSADPVDQTEQALRQAEGWNIIYDCGHAKWVWKSH
jgi:hypothetical protein